MSLRIFLFSILLVQCLAFSHTIQQIRNYTNIANSIIKEITQNQKGHCYNKLAFFTDTFAGRLSGSQSLENSISWLKEELEKEKFENIHEMRVQVPHWVRGPESLELISPRRVKMDILSLGFSVPTPENGLVGEVIVFKSFEEMEKNTSRVAGKIVLFNQEWKSYGETVQYRTNGPVRVAQAGGIACLVRSVTPFSLYTPHTGRTQYSDQIKKIPAAAVTVEDAEMMERMFQRNEKIIVNLTITAKTYPFAQSRNLIAEIRGSKYPEEIVLISGHIDSWDISPSAVDDVSGVIICVEAMRALIKLGLRPKRTIRFIAWTAEETGLHGAREYASRLTPELIKNHVIAFESDSGTFTPNGFGFTGLPRAKEIVQEIANLLKPINATQIFDGGSQADISFLIQLGIPGMNLRTQNEKYFYYHHSRADTITAYKPEELDACAASVGVMFYVLADIDERLPGQQLVHS